MSHRREQPGTSAPLGARPARGTHGTQGAAGPPVAVLVAVLVSLGVVGVGAPASAQGLGGDSSGSPDQRGYAQGQQEGRIEGRIEGMRLGRDQVVARAFVDAFREALEATPKDAAERYLAIARERADADGASAGRTAGVAAGRAAALADEAPPSAPEPPDPPGLPRDLDACRPPPAIELELPSQATAIFRLHLMPEGGIETTYELPEPELPSIAILRARARREEGLTGRDVGSWAEWFQRGYRDAFRETYHEQRESVPRATRAPFAQRGAIMGTLEGGRRVACDVIEGAWADTWTSSWRQAFAEGVESAVAAVRSGRARGPLVELEDARVVGDDDDGALEPGEVAWLVATVRNHGTASGDGPPPDSSLRAVRGLEPLPTSTGDDGSAGAETSEDAAAARAGHDVAVPEALATVPAPGESRSVRIAVGRVLAEAPVGSSVVVLVEPAAGRRVPVTAKVARPATLAAARGTLVADEGRLAVAVSAEVASTARAGTTDGLAVRVAESAAASPGPDAGAVPPLSPGERAVVEVTTPIGADVLAGEGEPVVTATLVDAEGRVWDARPAAVEVGVEELVLATARLDDPGPAVRRIWAALVGEIEASEGAPELLGDDSALARYARALADLSAEERAVLDERITRPLVEHVEKNATRALRKAVRSRLDG